MPGCSDQDRYIRQTEHLWILGQKMDSDNDNQPKQILKPRNPGEGLKVAETVLRKRNRDSRGQAERAQKRIDLKKVNPGK